MNRMICATLILGVFAAVATAQDRDGDGMSDALEYQLGSDTNHAEQFTLIYHDGVIGEDDETVSRKHENGPDVVDVYLANVARDRWLWKITFARDYVGEGNVFIIYLDADEDETTGRQDANTGTDLMYVQENGKFKVSVRNQAFAVDTVRMTSVGDAIYLCTDLPLSEGRLPGQLKFKILSHVAPPASADSDYSDWVIADLPQVRDADKPRIGAPPPLSPPAELTTDKPDADGDGIPDQIELQLGMDPEHADTLRLAHDDKSAAEGDRLSSHHKSAPDVTKIYFGNVAQDRWVWRVDFAEPVDMSAARVMLYLDADNDLLTGRQEGAQGTDVRLICQGNAFSIVVRNTDVLGRDRDIRGFVDEQCLYYSMDLVLNHNEEGNAECRGYILSQMVNDDADSDSTAWFTMVTDGEQDLPKARVGVVSQFLSEGAVVQKRWLTWRRQLGEMEAQPLDMTAAPVEGMKRFNGAVEPEAPGATVKLTSPVKGRRFVNVLIQDSAVGREQVTLRVAGRRVARFVAGQDDGDLYLFSTAKPVSLTKGTDIELVAKQPAQDFRICEVFLTRELPEPQPLTIEHLSVWVAPRGLPDASRGDTVDVDICFLTWRPVTGTVRWGEGDALDQEASETGSTYNHRIRLHGLTRGARYSVQAACREGADEITSKVLSFTADATGPRRCSVARRRVALHIADMMEGERPAWPVNGGVPIARGELASADRCRLLDADGRPVPAQFRELAYWPDGSVKWLLVSLVREGGAGQYVLEYGRDVSTPPVDGGIVVEPTGDGLRITTDRFQADISRERFAPPGTVTMDGRVVATGGEGLVLVDAEGNRYTSADTPATRFEVEEAGPVRVVLRVEGTLRGDESEGLRYRCRMYFYRGFAGIPTEVSVLVQEGKSGFPPTLSRIRSLGWVMRSDERAGRTRWVQDDSNHWVLDGEGRGGHGPAAATGGALTVAIRDFWQKYPKGFSRQDDTITAEIFPELPADRYARYTDPKLLTMNYYWFRDGHYLIPGGTEPTADVLLHFAGEDVAEAWQEQVTLVASPEHICASGAFMDLEPSKPGRFEAFDAFMREGLE
ncbi:MAG: fibronectin type III domain-containing protein, partial [Armatimonadetes bacterium]|nr:fibronectin type III domain-containing protein [Armatimonadota bacterium]